MSFGTYLLVLLMFVLMLRLIAHIADDIIEGKQKYNIKPKKKKSFKKRWKKRFKRLKPLLNRSSNIVRSLNGQSSGDNRDEGSNS